MPSERQCTNCHKTTTRRQWNSDFDGSWWCDKCFHKSVKGKAKVKYYNDIRNKQKIRFNGPQIFLGYNPRKGECNQCHKKVSTGEIQLTVLHHIEYNHKDPLAHTIELCVRCHNHIHDKGFIPGLFRTNKITA